MKAHYTEYVTNILNNYAKGNDKNGKIVMLKHYSAFEVNSEDIEKVVKMSGVDCLFLFHSFKESVIQEPYEPLLSWIRNICEEMSDEELKSMLIDAGVYRLHIPILYSYIKTGKCVREEEIIAGEVDYERKRFIDSLMSVIRVLSAGKMIIVIFHKLHNAQISTIQLLTEIMQRRYSNISVICGYNDMHTQEKYMQPLWNQMIKISERENYIIECGMEDQVQHSMTNKPFFIDVEELDTYLVTINNLLQSVAWSEAEFYINLVYNKIILEKVDLPDEKKQEIYFLCANIAIVNNKLKLAFLMCEKISTLDSFYKDVYTRYEYNKLIALIKVYDRQREQAVQYVDECNRIACELNDEDLIFETELLKYVACFGAWRDVFLWDKKIKITDEFLEKLEKKNKLNHLVYMCLYGFLGSYDSNEVSEEGYIGCEKSKYFRKGIEVAERIGNKNAILNGWQKQVIVASSRGEFDEITYYYEKCLAILREQNQMRNVGQVYIGLGYNCVISERYTEADEYFKSALEIFLKINEPNYIMETLYNMAINALLVEDMESVIFYITTVIRMMKRFNLQRMRLCNISKLYGMLIIAYLKSERLYDAKIYLDKMKRVVRHLQGEITEIDYAYWEDDLFLYNVVQGMIKMQEGHLDKAEEYFRKNIYYINIFSSKQEYIYAQFIVQVADLYEKLGKEEERKNILIDGIEFCEKNKNPYRKRKLMEYIDHNDIPWSKDGKIKFSIDIETKDDIEAITEKHGINIELEEKNKALMFFESWVDIINNESMAIDNIINLAMSTVLNTYNLDSVLWIEVNQQTNEPIIRYSDQKSSITKGQARIIIDHVSKLNRNIVIDRIEKSFDDNEEIVSIFDKKEISSMVVVPVVVKDKITNIFIAMRLRHMNFITNSSALSEIDANIFRTTFRQLVDAVRREVFKAKLEESSVTDILTGILNRQGMKKYIESQFLNGNNGKDFTVLYMDLDNFKYCNDHFGHDVGDAVLVAFSNMLGDILESNGSIVRYGGDEFVALLPGGNVADGIAVAEEIFYTLERNKGFKEEINNKLSKKVEIEKEHRVSCSIGVASGMCYSDSDIFDILKKADQALYKIKKTTKHDYEIWTAELEQE